MTYNYESLLDQHFQLMCQSLLLASFPSLQCMPVGMPDGGRDATSREDLSAQALVFQVKYARDPARIKDPVAWVTKAVSGELRKIERLAERGANQYVVITNLPGTSHLDGGRIDRVQGFLDSAVPIPAQCWWRDDLDRRIDANFDIKMRYPVLLDGLDLARLLWLSSTEGERTHVRGAIHAYLSDQSDRDSAIKFKQIDLPATSVFDLFVDVPVGIGGRGRHANLDHLQGFANVVGELVAEQKPLSGLDFRYTVEDELYVEAGQGRLVRGEIGAADLLLDKRFYERAPFVLVEGAPGQGKSTLTQYLAEANRARLLDSDTAGRIRATHAVLGIRLPIRLELRDIAQWLNGIDP